MAVFDRALDDYVDRDPSVDIQLFDLIRARSDFLRVRDRIVDEQIEIRVTGAAHQVLIRWVDRLGRVRERLVMDEDLPADKTAELVSAFQLRLIRDVRNLEHARHRAGEVKFRIDRQRRRRR